MILSGNRINAEWVPDGGPFGDKFKLKSTKLRWDISRNRNLQIHKLVAFGSFLRTKSCIYIKSKSYLALVPPSKVT